MFWCIHFVSQVLRVQSKAGRSVLKGLSQNSTLCNLQKLLEEKTNIPSDHQKSENAIVVK